MENLSRYSAVGIQTANQSADDKTSMRENLKRMIELIDNAVIGYELFGFPLKLVVFPEFAMQGLAYFTKEDLAKHEILVTIPGEETEILIEVAKKYDLYIQPGSMLEYDERWPGHFFNTACLLGPEGIALKYRKVQTFMPLEPATSPHSIAGYDEPLFPVADLSIGKVAIAICFDWIFPEILREYAMQGAEVFLGPKAYMPPFGVEMPSNWWNVVAQCRSLENVAYGVHVNQGAPIPPHYYIGGSCIVDYEGRVQSQVLMDGEQFVFGHIDLSALRDWRANTELHSMLTQVRTEAYTWLSRPIFPQGTLAPDMNQTQEHIKACIEDSRRVLHGELLSGYRWKK
jgi:predicted amidohydrolase